MSFGNFARKARDHSLPYRRRVTALRNCVNRYHPIGYEATLDYLKDQAGPYEHDEEALLRALAVVTASRELWKADVRRYWDDRSTAKQCGQRRPGPADHDPVKPAYWYGAPREAALHALRYWRRTRFIPNVMILPDDQVAADLEGCVVAVLGSGGPLSPAGRQLVAACAAELDGRRPGDTKAHARVRGLQWIARLVEVASREELSR